MKVFSAFCLFLPFAYGVILEFTSAIQVNCCGDLLNGGEGFGRVELITLSARCNNKMEMRLGCNYTLPENGGYRTGYWLCVNGKECVTSSIKNPADAGCVKKKKPSGVKGAADTDNHACSSGIAVGDKPLWYLSSIAETSGQNTGAIKECTITKSGTHNNIYDKAPCPRESTIIKLDARTTYQACIFTTLAFAKRSVDFTWHLSSPGKIVRSLGPQQPVSEMFTILNNTANANDGFQIVVEN